MFVNMKERAEELIYFLMPFMEENFDKSREIIQDKIVCNASEIWNDLKSVVHKVLERADELQKQNRKGSLQYLLFSFMQYGVCSGMLEINVSAYDDRFYLDEEEAAETFPLTFLQGQYGNDISYLYQKAEEKFVRIQNHERTDIREWYSDYYNSIAYAVVESLAELIMKEITESDVKITDCFKILYGGYMDQAVTVYSKEKH